MSGTHLVAASMVGIACTLNPAGWKNNPSDRAVTNYFALSQQ